MSEEELVDTMAEMLHVVVRKYKLESGDISPEDYSALIGVVRRYIENNESVSN